jgi:hypothetical protein
MRDESKNKDLKLRTRDFALAVIHESEELISIFAIIVKGLKMKKVRS